MKKRFYKKSELSGLSNYKYQFFEYVEHFFYGRVILSAFIFILYFGMFYDNQGKSVIGMGPNDVLFFAFLFSYLVYVSVFNLARFLFCTKHKTFPIFNLGVNLTDGWLKFDYSSWEKKQASKAEYYLTVVFDSAVFFVTIIVVTIITLLLLI